MEVKGRGWKEKDGRWREDKGTGNEKEDRGKWKGLDV